MLVEILDKLKSIPLDEDKYSSPFTLGESFEDVFQPLDKEGAEKRTKLLSPNELRVGILGFLNYKPCITLSDVVDRWSDENYKYKGAVSFVVYLDSMGKLRDFYRQEVMGIRESFADVFQPASDEELDKQMPDVPDFLRRFEFSIVYITEDVFYIVLKDVKYSVVKNLFDDRIGQGIERSADNVYTTEDGTALQLDTHPDKIGGIYIRIEKNKKRT